MPGKSSSCFSIAAPIQNMRMVPEATALHAACRAKSAEIAGMLIERSAAQCHRAPGAKIGGEAADGTPLYYAVVAQQPELVGFLLDHGADANIPRPTSGRHHSILAVGRSDESIVTLLLAHGAKPDLADENGNSALHYATQIRAPIGSTASRSRRITESC